jgi:dephospho-CoA kinase
VSRLLRVALTGGIATGKSVCLSHFAARGAPVIDADTLARRAVAPGMPALDAVTRRFGPGILGPDGHLDRATLGRIVFADATARRDLEAIIHPIVYEGITRWFADQQDRLTDARAKTPASAARHEIDLPGFAVAGIPLLFETGRRYELDRIVVAACTPEQQLARLMARDALSELGARQRIAAQLPIEDKRARADFVVDTSGTLEETERQVTAVFDQLKREAGVADRRSRSPGPSGRESNR